MAKLTIVAVLLVALLAFTEASFRATVTTTTIEEEAQSDQQQSRCSSQLQRYRFRNCQRYLSQSGPYVDEDEALENQQQQQTLRQCCQELQNVDEQCQCEAIRYVVRQQQQEGGRYAGQGSRQVMQKAQYLPRQCNLGVQQCRILAVVV